MRVCPSLHTLNLSGANGPDVSWQAWLQWVLRSRRRPDGLDVLIASLPELRLYRYGSRCLPRSRDDFVEVDET
jgi:hypothetical protein